MAISLQKGKKVSLKKTQKELGEILVNLNWNRPQQKGFLASLFGPKAIDLDLGCLYELKNGKKRNCSGAWKGIRFSDTAALYCTGWR